MNDRLDELDLKFHASLFEQQALLQAQMQGQLDTWQRYLALKYTLKQGDSVAAGGAIIRAEAPQA